MMAYNGAAFSGFSKPISQLEIRQIPYFGFCALTNNNHVVAVSGSTFPHY